MTSGRVRARPAAAASDGEVGRSRLVRIERGAHAVPRADASRSRRNGGGWLPALTLITALALVVIAIGDTAARSGAGWGQPLFYLGLVAIFAPTAARLVSTEASRGERVGLVVLVGLGLYVVKVLHDPVAFTTHDELGHWRAVDDILRTGHLFHVNPIVRTYSAYPGMDVVASGLVRLSGLSIFGAGVIIIAAARLVIMLALFYVFEQVTGSARIAGIAGLLYATNPNFLFFDGLFAYESFALPLLALVLLVVAGVQGAPLARRAGLGLLGVGLIFAVVVSHHISSYALVIFLALWALAAVAVHHRRGLPLGRRVTAFMVIALGATLLWLLFVAAGLTRSELGPVLTGIVSGVGELVGGGGGGKELFRASSGQAVEPLWAQVLGFGSVILVLVAIPFALWRGWRRRRSAPIMLAFGVATLAYPVTLGLRLTQAGTETSNRASEFLFIGISVLLAVAVAELWLPPATAGGRLRWPRRRVAAFSVYATILLIGGVIVGWPPYDRLPGPYLPAAGQRSIDREGVADAFWARNHLPPRSRVLADETQALLMASYGRQDPQGGKIEGLSLARVFFSPTFGSDDRRVLVDDRIRYLVVDQRLSDVLPLRGVYVEGDEPGAFQHRSPIPPRALTKFNHVAGLSRLLDSGHVAVYDVTDLRRGSPR